MAKKVILKDENLIEVMPITRAELVLDSAGNLALHSREFLATDTLPGLMSPDDKQKLETVTGNTVDTELSNTSTNPVQNKVLTQIINSIRDEYLKSAVISGNKITITDQSNNTIEFSNSAYQIVTDTIDGLVPKYDAVDGIIDTHLTDWVLANHNGTLGWYKLPANAFKNDNTNTTYLLSGSLNGNTYITTLTDSDSVKTAATVPAMSGASSTAAGTAGLVPAPAINNHTAFLRGDGTWAVPINYYRPISVNGTSILENNNTALNLVAGDNISITAENSSGYTGKVTITNTGVRSTTIHENYLRVDTNGTNTDLTIPYATLAGSVAWENITDKPSSFAPSAHDHTKILFIDDRDTDETPTDVAGKNGIEIHFKNKSKSGITSTGTWTAIVMLDGYSDVSGGYPMELGFSMSDLSESRPLYLRTPKSATEWGGWRTILDSSTYTNYTVQKDGTGASGTWDIDISGTATSSTSSNYSRNLLGRKTSGGDYDAVAGNLIFAEWNTHNDNRWYLKAEGCETRVAYATSAGNADTVDDLHASDFVKFYLSPLTSGAPADSAKDWFVNTMPSASGAIVYNVPGSEKTIIVGKSSGSFGHMLQLNYDDNYLRILRYFSGSWKTTDWEKISAGYADSANYATSAGSADYAASAGVATNASRLTINGIDDATTYGTYGGIYQSNINGPESGNWHNSWKILHNNSSGYYTQLAQNFTGTHGLWHRSNRAGTISKWIRVLDDNMAVARYSTTGSTNYIKIKINSAEYWMLGFTVRVYLSYTYYDIRFSGYNYGTNYWYSPKASLTDGDAKVTVYFGYDAVNQLWVGIPGGNYTGVEISNVVNGYYAHGKKEALAELFTISNVSSLGGTTLSTQELQQTAHFADTASNADTVDNLHASAFMLHRGWWSSDKTYSADGIATGMYFAYANHGVPNHWGTLVTFAYQESSSYNLQLHGTGDNYLYYRNRSADYGLKPWKRLAAADELKNPADYYWANVQVSSSSNPNTSPTFASATVTDRINATNYVFLNPNGSGIYLNSNSLNWHDGSAYKQSLINFTSDGKVGIGTATPSYKLDVTNNAKIASICFEKNDEINRYGGHLYLQHRGNIEGSQGSARTGNILMVNNGGNVGIGTPNPSYKLHVSGDSYTTGWSRAASGFYVEGTGVHYTSQGSVGEIDMSSNNEFLWGSSSATLYFNYRAVSRGTTVTNYIWNAGSSSSYASHTLGKVKAQSTASSWLDGQRYERGGFNLMDAADTGSYWPWMRQTNTGSSKWFSMGVLNNSLYFIGSATSRTENGYDYGFTMDFSNGYLYGNFSGYLSGTASNVTVNSSDANSTYRMVWHSGNTLYGTGGIYCNPSSDYLYATSMNASDWFRSSGNTGWYNPTNNCHVYPNATTTYGGLMLRGEKGGYTGFILGTSTNYMNLMDNGTDKGLYQEGKLWILYYNRSNNYVGIRTAYLSDPLTVAGVTRVVASDRYLRIGPQNASHAHYETTADRSHWFNKRVEVNGVLNPYVNNSYTCGTNDYRWSNVYSYSGNFAGSVTITYNSYPGLTIHNNTTSGEASMYIKNNTAGWALGVNPWSQGAGIFAIGQYSGTGSSNWRFKIDNNGYCYTSSYLNLGAGNEKNASNPPYVWGVNGSDNFMRTYATSSLSVNYATSAGNADTVDGVHLEWFGTQAASSTTWLAGWNADGTKIKAVKRADLSVNYATSAGSANGLASTGYGNYNLTYYQTDGSFFGNSGWSHYIIANHGDGSSYYNFTIGLPFWGVPIYKRLEGGTADGWYTFITSENISSQSVNYASSAGNANTVDNYHIWAGSSSSLPASRNNNTIYLVY